VLPLAYDQGFWAKSVKELGVGSVVNLANPLVEAREECLGGFGGPDPINTPNSKPRHDNLRCAMRSALQESLRIAFSPDTAEAAATLAQLIRANEEEESTRSCLHLLGSTRASVGAVVVAQAVVQLLQMEDPES
jgi:hypothetical protein